MVCLYPLYSVLGIDFLTFTEAGPEYTGGDGGRGAGAGGGGGGECEGGEG